MFRQIWKLKKIDQAAVAKGKILGPMKAPRRLI